MATDLTVVQTYAAAPDAVIEKFADRAFLDGRLQAAGGLDPSVTQLESAGSGAERTVTIVLQQSIPASALPSMVATLMPGDPVTVRTEKWRATADGYIADFDVVIKGAPASLQGTMSLAPTAAGSTLSVDGAASVPIPLFGGKIESVIVEQVEKLLQAEEIYTQSQLAG